ncbi:peptide chain release factor 2 [Gammaproteobacteria bacterium]|nr:peptide chain release factor 2 [Gammaproteobacteria bacterium]MDB3976490.1 peptide chain release factor 2 [Gammaproteobacteria bacterium]MDB3994145.1 peptide chain release factor 2 [Gammaproteobacteria bacterium]MDC1251642.1 peptide chain release factor 2 [Gammaproteobacteria bacterium]
MIEITSLNEELKDHTQRVEDLRGYLDVEQKQNKLNEVTLKLSDPSVWDDPQKAQDFNKEKVYLERELLKFHQLEESIQDALELAEIAIEEDDASALEEIANEMKANEAALHKMEFIRMFSNKMDPNNAYLDIQSGSGGTEAQDWAEMLMRMYLKWGESKGFETEVIEVSHGEVAGIKSAAIKFNGDYAYGWLRTETGVHRLVRKSPFDSGSRRHTSFASIFISPEVDETVEIEVNPADLRIDTYRASGAGGQHVNKTDSAIRITHLPTGVVSQCQSQRSQHQNRDKAMAQLRAKLYEIEMNKLNEEKQSLEESKADIGWGSQIRSYVLDSSRIKDLRTGVETTNCSAVLDGALDNFIEASLKENI